MLLTSDTNYIYLIYLQGEKSNQQRIETLLHIVLKFQFSHACLRRTEASTNVMLVTTKFLETAVIF